MGTVCVPGAHSGQERVLDLGLQMVVGHHVHAGNPTLVLCKIKVFFTTEPLLRPHLHIYI